MMAKLPKPRTKISPGLPVYQRIQLERILEPELPARASMDSDKMHELMESMKSVGQIEPISVEQHDAMYEIMTGHRRFLAARSLGWAELNALVYPEGQGNKLALMLHENTIREDLNPGEEALFMAQAKEQLGLDEAGLCAMFHRSAEYIGGRFALLRGDAEVFAAVQRGDIRLGVAHQLNRVTDEGMRRYYLDAALRADPPARVVAQWVQDWMTQERARQHTIPAGGVSPGQAPDSVSSPGGNGASAGSDGNHPTTEPAPFFGCMLCGGDKDPFNLVDVRLHKWEWEQILKQVEKAARGEV